MKFVKCHFNDALPQKERKTELVLPLYIIKILCVLSPIKNGSKFDRIILQPPRSMPAHTNDPISSVLQRTFGGLEQKKEGLIRGGNSASAKSFNVLDKKLQATSKSSTMSGIHIQFDEPTQYSSGSAIRQQMNGGNANGTGSTPKVIVLNPQFLPKQTENNASERNCSSQNEPSKLPKPKVRRTSK